MYLPEVLRSPGESQSSKHNRFGSAGSVHSSSSSSNSERRSSRRRRSLGASPTFHHHHHHGHRNQHGYRWKQEEDSSSSSSADFIADRWGATENSESTSSRWDCTSSYPKESQPSSSLSEADHAGGSGDGNLNRNGNGNPPSTKARRRKRRSSTGGVSMHVSSRSTRSTGSTDSGLHLPTRSRSHDEEDDSNSVSNWTAATTTTTKSFVSTSSSMGGNSFQSNVTRGEEQTPAVESGRRTGAEDPSPSTTADEYAYYYGEENSNTKAAAEEYARYYGDNNAGNDANAQNQNHDGKEENDANQESSSAVAAAAAKEYAYYYGEENNNHSANNEASNARDYAYYYGDNGGNGNEINSSYEKDYAYYYGEENNTNHLTSDNDAAKDYAYYYGEDKNDRTKGDDKKNAATAAEEYDYYYGDDNKNNQTAKDYAYYYGDEKNSSSHSHSKSVSFREHNHYYSDDSDGKKSTQSSVTKSPVSSRTVKSKPATKQRSTSKGTTGSKQGLEAAISWNSVETFEWDNTTASTTKKNTAKNALTAKSRWNEGAGATSKDSTVAKIRVPRRGSTGMTMAPVGASQNLKPERVTRRFSTGGAPDLPPMELVPFGERNKATAVTPSGKQLRPSTENKVQNEGVVSDGKTTNPKSNIVVIPDVHPAASNTNVNPSIQFPKAEDKVLEKTASPSLVLSSVPTGGQHEAGTLSAVNVRKAKSKRQHLDSSSWHPSPSSRWVENLRDESPGRIVRRVVASDSASSGSSFTSVGNNSRSRRKDLPPSAPRPRVSEDQAPAPSLRRRMARRSSTGGSAGFGPRMVQRSDLSDQSMLDLWKSLREDSTSQNQGNVNAQDEPSSSPSPRRVLETSLSDRNLVRSGSQRVLDSSSTHSEPAIPLDKTESQSSSRVIAEGTGRRRQYRTSRSERNLFSSSRLDSSPSLRSGPTLPKVDEISSTQNEKRSNPASRRRLQRRCSTGGSSGFGSRMVNRSDDENQHSMLDLWKSLRKDVEEEAKKDQSTERNESDMPGPLPRRVLETALSEKNLLRSSSRRHLDSSSTHSAPLLSHDTTDFQSRSQRTIGEAAVPERILYNAHNASMSEGNLKSRSDHDPTSSSLRSGAVLPKVDETRTTQSSDPAHPHRRRVQRRCSTGGATGFRSRMVNRSDDENQHSMSDLWKSLRNDAEEDSKKDDSVTVNAVDAPLASPPPRKILETSLSERNLSRGKNRRSLDSSSTHSAGAAPYGGERFSSNVAERTQTSRRAFKTSNFERNLHSESLDRVKERSVQGEKVYGTVSRPSRRSQRRSSIAGSTYSRPQEFDYVDNHHNHSTEVETRKPWQGSQMQDKGRAASAPKDRWHTEAANDKNRSVSRRKSEVKKDRVKNATRKGSEYQQGTAKYLRSFNLDLSTTEEDALDLSQSDTIISEIKFDQPLSEVERSIEESPFPINYKKNDLVKASSNARKKLHGRRLSSSFDESIYRTKSNFMASSNSPKQFTPSKEDFSSTTDISTSSAELLPNRWGVADHAPRIPGRRKMARRGSTGGAPYIRPRMVEPLRGQEEEEDVTESLSSFSRKSMPWKDPSERACDDSPSVKERIKVQSLSVPKFHTTAKLVANRWGAEGKAGSERPSSAPIYAQGSNQTNTPAPSNKVDVPPNAPPQRTRSGENEPLPRPRSRRIMARRSSTGTQVMSAPPPSLDNYRYDQNHERTARNPSRNLLRNSSPSNYRSTKETGRRRGLEQSSQHSTSTHTTTSTVVASRTTSSRWGATDGAGSISSDHPSNPRHADQEIDGDPHRPLSGRRARRGSTGCYVELNSAFDSLSKEIDDDDSNDSLFESWESWKKSGDRSDDSSSFHDVPDSSSLGTEDSETLLSSVPKFNAPRKSRRRRSLGPQAGPQRPTLDSSKSTGTNDQTAAGRWEANKQTSSREEGTLSSHSTRSQPSTRSRRQDEPSSAPSNELEQPSPRRRDKKMKRRGSTGTAPSYRVVAV